MLSVHFKTFLFLNVHFGVEMISHFDGAISKQVS